MPYPNERRKSNRHSEEELSPEYLAMLMVCGGEVRAEDRTAALEVDVERRRRRRAEDVAAESSERAPVVGNAR